MTIDRNIGMDALTVWDHPEALLPILRYVDPRPASKQIDDRYHYGGRRMPYRKPSPSAWRRASRQQSFSPSGARQRRRTFTLASSCP